MTESELDRPVKALEVFEDRVAQILANALLREIAATSQQHVDGEDTAEGSP